MRYFGGKQRIAKYISGYINNNFGGNNICNILVESKESQNTYPNSSTTEREINEVCYVEPFCGSCNVASKIHIKNKILNDKHPYLIAMFKALQNGWIPPTIVTEEEYHNTKLNQDKEPYKTGFIGFACSFAGKWWGGYARSDIDRNYASNGKNSILEKMNNLMNANFTCNDFLDLNFKDCIIYCDPPYKNTTQYCRQLLGEFPYDKFIEWVKTQSKNNIVLVSEYKHNVPEDAYIVLEIPSRTDIRDNTGNFIETTEILFTYNKNIK